MIDTSTSKTKTKLGTPCSKKWDTEWIDLVDKCEAQLGHRCCGAHAPDNLPCELISDHPNGRCRFHGGINGIGAPKENTNARIHGLYSRRLQNCGDHCPMWKTCPLAGPDINKLSPAKRPICPYEQDEYNLLSKLEKDTAPLHYERYATEKEMEPHKFLPEITCLRENLKTLQIMITRAASALKTGLTQSTSVIGKDYSMETSKPSAALQAYQILSREHRQTTTLYERMIGNHNLPTELRILTQGDETKAPITAEIKYI